MNQQSLKRNIAWLRICVLAFLLAILCLFLFSFTVSSRLAGDVWQQLGISQLQGTEKIRTSFLNDYFDYYGVRNLRNIAAGDKVAIAKDLLGFTRQYISGPAFKEAYARIRMEAQPVEPAGPVKTKELIRKEKIEETRKAIDNLEESMKKMDAEMKKAMQPGLEMQKELLKEYQDSASQMIELFHLGEVMNRENDIRRYKEDLQNWETHYPADYKAMIRARLQRYLAIAGTVDFDAELTARNGKQYFVKAEYERKSADWKMIFRAGKDVYLVTKAFADSWLKEL